MDWDILPIDLGLPDRFEEWRPEQTEAMEYILHGEKRFTTLAMPTGSGKSLAVMGALRLLDKHAVILTGTKGLQDQYTKDFGVPAHVLRAMRKLRVETKLKLTDLRGKANYMCSENPGMTCADGVQLHCKCVGTKGCPYSDALTKAQETDVVVTNYACWLNTPALAEGVDVLVTDEGHLAPEQLASHLRVVLYEKEVLDFAPLLGDQTTQGVALDMGEDLTEWRDRSRVWVRDVQQDISALLKQLRAGKNHARGFDKLRKLNSLYDKLRQIAMISGAGPDDRWTCEKSEGHARHGRHWSFDPVWPGAAAENCLFRGIERVISISASNRPKTMHLMGLGRDEFEFREWRSNFPPDRFPVYSIPSVRINWKTGEDELREWMALIDRIIGARLDRKGIIHTVSYDRQRYIMANSRYKHLFIGNTDAPGSPTAAQVVETFRRASPPAALVSPSFGTGWDFPYQECEWQIICKLPYPPIQSKVMKARLKFDPQYATYLAAQEIVQQRGRGCRAPDDRCETFIVDEGYWKWFRHQAKPFLPKGFDVRRMLSIPAPPPSLAKERKP